MLGLRGARTGKSPVDAQQTPFSWRCLPIRAPHLHLAVEEVRRTPPRSSHPRRLCAAPGTPGPAPPAPPPQPRPVPPPYQEPAQAEPPVDTVLGQGAPPGVPAQAPTTAMDSRGCLRQRCAVLTMQPAQTHRPGNLRSDRSTPARTGCAASTPRSDEREAGRSSQPQPSRTADLPVLTRPTPMALKTSRRVWTPRPTAPEATAPSTSPCEPSSARHRHRATPSSEARRCQAFWAAREDPGFADVHAMTSPCCGASTCRGRCRAADNALSVSAGCESIQRMEEPAESLSSDQVSLRRWRMSDLDALDRAISESLAHLVPWMPWAANTGRQQTTDFLTRNQEEWKAREAFGYAITSDAAADRQLRPHAPHRRGRPRYRLLASPSLDRPRLATTAAAALVRQGFKLAGIDRIEIQHDVANGASGAVARRLGFAEVERREVPGGPVAPGEVGIDVSGG